MTLKITIIILFLVGLKFVCSSFIKPVSLPVTPIDTTWWNELTEEWKTIFLVNQCFKKHGVDVFKLQNEYINRLNTGGENNYSEINTSLNELYDMRKFGLSYTDMYFRALRKNYVTTYNNIDLASLGELDTIYMVNGPGDLTPLRKFIHLKVLIINFCGIDNSLPISKQVLNLEPLEYLKELRILHCTSIALQSLKPIENLINLEELYCDNSSITTLAPLRKLKKLKKISFGSKVNKLSAVADLVNLEELYIKGCKQVPDLSNLKNLKKLSVTENELVIVSSSHRITNIDFLKNVKELEFLDFNLTSYRGSLQVLNDLPHLKAVTLPRVSRTLVSAFKKISKNCVLINSFEFE